MVLEHKFPGDPRVENEIEILKDAGHEVSIMATSLEKPFLEKESWQGVQIFRRFLPQLTYKSSVGALRFPLYFSFWRKFLSDIIGNNKVDAIHVHDLMLAKPVRVIARKHNIPYVLDTHENYPYLLNESPHTKSILGKILCNINEWKRYEKLELAKADRVLTVVEEMKQRYVDLGVKDEQIAVYQNVIHQGHWKISNSPINFQSRTGPTKIYYVGGVSLHRGLDKVISAIAQIIRSTQHNVELHIVGAGSNLETVQARTQDENLSHVVHFHGWVAQSKVPSLLQDADIAVIPHKKSIQTDCSSPNKLFQYLAKGIPVISSDCESVSRIVNDFKLGLVYPWQDVEALAQCILDFITLPAVEKEAISQNCILAVKNKFNTATEGQNLKKLYQELDQ